MYTLETNERRDGLTNPFASAFKYAELGFHVFPLTPNSKVPIKGSKGFYDATTDLDQIKQ